MATFIFFGGKGGVGKTTCAAAYGLARSNRCRVLLVSTDPAHSLGDALGVRLSHRVSRVTRRLDGVELDAPRSFERWLETNRRALGDILEHGTWLDRQDIETLLALSIPGIDELMAMLEIAHLADRGGARARGIAGRPRAGSAYDAVVVDTAPTGHTLRLLAAPEAVASVAAALDSLQREHRVIRAQFGGIAAPEAADRLIGVLADQAQRTHDVLRDRERSTFRWVTDAEELSSAESEVAVSELEAHGIDVREIIVNRVLPPGEPCPICDPRRIDQRRVLGRIQRGLGRGRLVRLVPAARDEPRGTSRLSTIGRLLIGAPRDLHSLLPSESPGRIRAGRGATAAQSIPHFARGNPELPDHLFGSKRLLFFGGKGGVGKTTTAAAAALSIARARAGRRILLLSTDPAHSLGDLFGVPIGDRSVAVPGAPSNLRIRELDASAAFREVRAALESALRDMLAAFAVAGGTGGVAELLELAPPGIDELFGMLAVQAARESDPDGHDLVIVDTAPTGHALRLLEMPGIALDWVHALMRVLLKYKAVLKAGRVAEELIQLARSIRSLQELVRDSARSGFVVVTRAAAVPREETGRLLVRLGSLAIPVAAVIVNAMTPGAGRCGYCRAAAAAEDRQLLKLLALIRRRPVQSTAAALRRVVIIRTPAVAPPPRGVATLEHWAQTWQRENVNPR